MERHTAYDMVSTEQPELNIFFIPFCLLIAVKQMYVGP